MTGRRRGMGLTAAAVSACAAMGAVSIAASAASPLPTVLTTIRCEHPCSKGTVGVYAVRPAKVVLAEAAGGNLQLVWSSWTASAGVGSGMSVASGMGITTQNLINVRASDPVGGHFTRLSVTFIEGTHNQTEHLHLIGVGSSEPAWAP
jgi:hypothetical protein